MVIEFIGTAGSADTSTISDHKEQIGSPGRSYFPRGSHGKHQKLERMLLKPKFRLEFLGQEGQRRHWYSIQLHCKLGRGMKLRNWRNRAAARWLSRPKEYDNIHFNVSAALSFNDFEFWAGSRLTGPPGEKEWVRYTSKRPEWQLSTGGYFPIGARGGVAPLNPNTGAPGIDGPWAGSSTTAGVNQQPAKTGIGFDPRRYSRQYEGAEGVEAFIRDVETNGEGDIFTEQYPMPTLFGRGGKYKDMINASWNISNVPLDEWLTGADTQPHLTDPDDPLYEPEPESGSVGERAGEEFYRNNMRFIFQFPTEEGVLPFLGGRGQTTSLYSRNFAPFFIFYWLSGRRRVETESRAVADIYPGPVKAISRVYLKRLRFPPELDLGDPEASAAQRRGAVSYGTELFSSRRL